MVSIDASVPLPSRLPARFWARHANPWSGGTRIAAGPVLMYALYHRRWRLLAATILFLVVNPMLFPEPASEATDNWLSKGVLGEQAWFEDGNPTFGTSYPALLNAVGLPIFLGALYAAVTRRPVATVVGTAVAVGLKFWFVDEMVTYYEETRIEVTDTT
ncbi:DUF6653 family protein [Haloferacaceae archaeon DSL9]